MQWSLCSSLGRFICEIHSCWRRHLPPLSRIHWRLIEQLISPCSTHSPDCPHVNILKIGRLQEHHSRSGPRYLVDDSMADPRNVHFEVMHGHYRALILSAFTWAGSRYHGDRSLITCFTLRRAPLFHGLHSPKIMNIESSLTKCFIIQLFPRKDIKGKSQSNCI